ncbi:acyl-CoA thioesterase [Microbacterium thalassium]|uniref:4-hydroxybenzoyl-CoA thioesterase n=1 Tax=Microbacterium thalassium TaxID=362649 RepID=A0A7X0FPA8_9MICO|nr:acyl-CoA thioesterase [Microbacterium thalassium]MBB6390685.1 4-hydroxybenzoyl-CoA thioesterase [Microbacterium thalassium]GLK25794.1 acyl-CoA thioesterase [Microbacterium thalassium]
MSTTTSEPVAGHDDRVTMRFLSLPHDAAAGGATVAAGSVMEWIDQAAYACAVGWSGGYCVTAYVGNVRHASPIKPGSLVAVHARIVHTGSSSMHVAVTVESADIRDRVYTANTTCILVFVAVGEDRKPVRIPAWAPASETDRELAAAAVARIPARDAIKKAMLTQEYSEATEAPRSVLRFLVPPSSVNFGGAAHGGTVMRWIDEAAFACAASWSSDQAVAVYSGGIHFLAPVRIGHVIELDARLIYTGPRSMHISVRVLTADPRTPDAKVLSTQCMLIFVDRGADAARPVRRWEPSLPEDVALTQHAVDLIHRREELVPIPAEVTLRD